jgi:drug/metabolite transporter (DMT)-like permease
LPAVTPTAEILPRPSTTRAQSPWLVLAFSLLGIYLAAPLVRLSSAAPLVIATWRLGFSLIFIAVALLVTGEWRAWRQLSRAEFALACGAGVLLALHFWSWNASINYTTVAASVSLVNTQPVIIALISAKWLGERPSRRQWVGIVIAVGGALVVGWSDVPADLPAVDQHRALFGDLLACVGAVTAALYYLIGRRIRRTLALWPYVGLVYGAAFVGSAGLSLLTGDTLVPQPPRELAIFAGLAIGPMLLGHTGMNWALGHLPAYVVNLTTLGEPIGATLLAALLPGIAEVPGPGTLIGGAVVLCGVLLAARKA